MIEGALPRNTDILIVGGGISGLSLAYFLTERLKEQGDPRKVTLLEKADRVGGTVRTVRQDGFICEAGPNGFLDNKPRTGELASSAGLQSALLPSNDRSRIRYIYHTGKFHKLPGSVKEFLTSDLLSVGGRIRVAGEVFTRPSRSEDETVAEFGRRHIGKEAVEVMIDPFISGVFAGDPECLSLRSIMPKMAEMDKTYGSLIKALKAMQKKKREMEKATGKKLPSASPFGGGTLTSFKDGLATLTDQVAAAGEFPVIMNAEVTALRQAVDGAAYTVEVSVDGKSGSIESSEVVLATPAYVTAKVLEGLVSSASNVLTKIEYAAAAVLCLGYRKEELGFDLNGFGFLVPHREKRKILGSVWASSVFDHRAPEGCVLLQVVAGGACDSVTPLLPDEELLKVVREELKDIMGITASPVLTKIFKYEKAIPQYNVGHQKRLDELNAVLEHFPGLYLTGNAYLGVGLNDCIENSFKLAEKIAPGTGS